jgi:hypothetical protein
VPAYSRRPRQIATIGVLRRGTRCRKVSTIGNAD